MLAYKPQLKPLARRLRAAMTDAEHRLQFRLRRKQLLGVQFYRQKPIGKYIVDFRNSMHQERWDCCAKATTAWH